MRNAVIWLDLENLHTCAVMGISENVRFPAHTLLRQNLRDRDRSIISFLYAKLLTGHRQPS